MLAFLYPTFRSCIKRFFDFWQVKAVLTASQRSYSRDNFLFAQTWKCSMADKWPVIFESQVNWLQNNVLLEAKRSLDATENSIFLKKEVRNVGSMIFSPFYKQSGGAGSSDGCAGTILFCTLWIFTAGSDSELPPDIPPVFLLGKRGGSISKKLWWRKQFWTTRWKGLNKESALCWKRCLLYYRFLDSAIRVWETFSSFHYSTSCSTEDAGEPKWGLFRISRAQQ